MRTGIYVYKTTTLTIDAAEPVVLTSLDNRTISLPNIGIQTTKLDPGIYKAVTNSKISVTSEDSDSANIDVVAVADDKDPFPDAPAAAVKAFNVSTSTITTFFKIVGLKSAAF